jgi:hypothetical protein
MEWRASTQQAAAALPLPLQRGHKAENPQGERAKQSKTERWMDGWMDGWMRTRTRTHTEEGALPSGMALCHPRPAGLAPLSLPFPR